MSEGTDVGQAIALKESDKALLVQIIDLEEQVWVPKSQIHDDSEVFKSDQSGKLVVTNWFAEKQGWL